MTVEPLRKLVDAEEVRDACRSLVGARPDDAVVVGLTAAAVWDLPLPPSAAAQLRMGHVAISRRSGRVASRRKALNGHALALPAEHVTELDGLCLTTPSRTWLDCAALLGAEHLLAMGDCILSRKLSSLEALMDLIAWARRRRGVVNARHVAPLLRTGSESPQESRLRWKILASGLPEPDINPEIVLPERNVVRLDLAYVGLRIAIEFDGDWHVATRAHDVERRRDLAANGWIVIVARKEDLYSPEAVISSIKKAVKERTSVLNRRW